MKIIRLVFNPVEVNTYILADESGDCAVIDCGCYDQHEFAELTDLLSKEKLKPVLLLNTHCHLDHIFGNGFMLEKFNLRALIHEEDEKNRKNAVNHALMFGLSMDAPPEPGGYLSAGQKLAFGSTELLTLHVPGHSRGSVAFYSEKDHAVFTGDALFSGSIGRTDLPGGDFRTLISAISTRLFTLPRNTEVYPGHGEKTTIDSEMKTNPYFVRG
jgi:glyoxylase-like metal-dependent hydrolase (beta-lactamase superfamily II)